MNFFTCSDVEFALAEAEADRIFADLMLFPDASLDFLVYEAVLESLLAEQDQNA
jgi:hypothetical protein